MAADISVVLEKFRADLTCPICREILREPKSLPCLHSFCRECLKENVRRRIVDARADPTDARNVLKCPVCNFRLELGPAPEGDPDVAGAVDSIRTNVCLKNLIGHYQLGQEIVGRSRKSRCGFCDEADNEAVAFCQSRCNRLLCEVCLRAHGRMTLTSQHQILGLEAARSTTGQGAATPVIAYRSRKCSAHFTKGRDDPNERMTDMIMYCYDCKDVICCMCALAEHQPHQKNVAKKVIDELEHRPRIEEKIGETRATECSLNDLSALYHEKKLHIEDARSSTEEKVKGRFKDLNSMLDNDRDSLLKKVSAIHRLHMRRLEEERTALDVKRKAVEHAVKFIRRRKTLASREDMVHLGREMAKRGSSLLEEARLNPPVGAYPREINYRRGDMNLSGVMGNVSAEPCIDIFTAEDVMRLDFVRGREVEFTVTARDVFRDSATAESELVFVELQPTVAVVAGDRPDDAQASVIKASVKSLQSGKCLVSLTPRETGPHTLKIQVARAGKFEHIQDSPFDIVVTVNPFNIYEI